MSKDRLSRRQFLRRLTIGGGLVLGMSTIGGAIWALTKGKESDQMGFYYPEVELYYPELAKIQVKESGVFETRLTTTKWLNYSDHASFDPEKASQIYNLFESLDPTLIPYKIDLWDKTINLSLTPRAKRERIIFIVPQTVSPPNWGINTSPYAATTGITSESPSYATFIRIVDSGQLPDAPTSENTQIASNFAFMTEACQGSIGIYSLNPELSNLAAQEVGCISLGHAFTLKQAGNPYDQYLTLTVGKTIEGPTFSLPPLILDRDTYEGIPQVGMPITIKSD